MKLCECGCGKATNLSPRTEGGYRKGEPRRFVRGHQLIGRNLPPRNHGLCVDKSDGRTQIICRDGSKVRFYRAVMEAHLGRHLLPTEHVHHKNGDPADDRIENLEILDPSEHQRRHFEERTHCRRGHELTPENTYIYAKTGHRQCKTCNRLRNREYAARKKAAA